MSAEKQQFASGKVIWITGATSGIGEELAKQFALQNAILILSARRINELERVKSNCLAHTKQVEILQLDLNDLSSLHNIAEQAIALFGRIDILINNGGISQRSTAMETEKEVEHRIMNINYFSAVALSKAVIPIMEKNAYGKIVLMSSITGKIGVPNRSTYCASKHALIGYFDALRAENTIKKSPVQIHIIMPGFIKTNISYNSVTGDGNKQAITDPGQANGMPVDVCVRKIIKAIKNNKKEVLIGGKEIWMADIRRFLPGLYYRLIAKVRTR